MILDDIWSIKRTELATALKQAYESTTQDSLEQADAVKIETLLYNYTHVLRRCNLAFSDDFQDNYALLQEIFVHKAYVLVTEWKMICECLKIDNGKQIHQESFYDVADTPRIETKDYNELNIRKQQLDNLYYHSQAIKEFYNEVKLIVQTIYW